MANSPGTADSFEYVTGDGTKWRASLEDVKNQVTIPSPFGGQSTSDPEFIHVPENPDANHIQHQDAYIKYITGDGSYWTSKAHSHTDSGGRISFTFEHFRDGSNDADHEDSTLIVMVDGKKWKIRVADIGAVDAWSSHPVHFEIEEI